MDDILFGSSSLLFVLASHAVPEPFRVIAARVGDSVGDFLPGLLWRDWPYHLQGRHGRKPRRLVRRTSAALFTVGWARCSSRWPAFGSWYGCSLGHVWHDVAVRSGGEAVGWREVQANYGKMYRLCKYRNL